MMLKSPKTFHNSQAFKNFQKVMGAVRNQFKERSHKECPLPDSFTFSLELFIPYIGNSNTSLVNNALKDSMLFVVWKSVWPSFHHAILGFKKMITIKRQWKLLKCWKQVMFRTFKMNQRMSLPLNWIFKAFLKAGRIRSLWFMWGNHSIRQV